MSDGEARNNVLSCIIHNCVIINLHFTSNNKVFTDMKTMKIAKLSDWHVPYEDEKAIKVAMLFLKDIKPDIVVIDEVTDFYPLSRFDKDPQRALTMQDDIDKTKRYYKTLRSTCPDARIIQVKSNHDVRLEKYLAVRAKELIYLDSLKFRSLLKLSDYDIKLMEHYSYKNVLFKHGDIVRKHSAYTARGEFEREGCSGCSGHTHRLGVHYVTLRGGSYVWVEGGCLCDTRPEYIKGVANWQQGFTLWTFIGKQFFAQPIPIIDHKILFGGKLYESKSKRRLVSKKSS